MAGEAAPVGMVGRLEQLPVAPAVPVRMQAVDFAPIPQAGLQPAHLLGSLAVG